MLFHNHLKVVSLLLRKQRIRVLRKMLMLSKVVATTAAAQRHRTRARLAQRSLAAFSPKVEISAIFLLLSTPKNKSQRTMTAAAAVAVAVIVLLTV